MDVLCACYSALSANNSPVFSIICSIPASMIGDMKSEALSINASPVSEASLPATFLKVALRIPVKDMSGAPAAINAALISAFSRGDRYDSTRAVIASRPNLIMLGENEPSDISKSRFAVLQFQEFDTKEAEADYASFATLSKFYSDPDYCL